jgi:drug/metabolite transporter (DMT)-like permease
MTAQTEWAVVGLGLLSAVLWGAGDFSGGVASRRTNVFSVVAIAHAVGLALVIGLALLRGEPLYTPADLAWGALAGLVGGVGLVALYRALAVGQMGVAAPVAAVLSAAVPVAFSGLMIGLPKSIQLIGFGLALVGVWLVSGSARVKGKPTGLGLAALAGVSFGGFFILIHRASPDAVFWPLAAARLASSLLLGLIVIRRGVVWRPPQGMLWVIALAGILDVLANAVFLVAAQMGRLDVVGVVSSQYPATTVLLAWLILKGRITRPQMVGILATLVAIALIAA